MVNMRDYSFWLSDMQLLFHQLIYLKNHCRWIVMPLSLIISAFVFSLCYCFLLHPEFWMNEIGIQEYSPPITAKSKDVVEGVPFIRSATLASIHHSISRAQLQSITLNLNFSL